MILHSEEDCLKMNAFARIIEAEYGPNSLRALLWDELKDFYQKQDKERGIEMKIKIKKPKMKKVTRKPVIGLGAKKLGTKKAAY